MLRALEAVLAVDHHCHPLRRWPHRLTVLELRAAFSEALDSRIPQDHTPNTAAYRDALHRLGRELGCPPTEAAILAAREDGDPGAYANRLLERTRTALLLIDHGFGGADAFSVAEHAAAIAIPQREVVRLETLGERLVGSCDTVADWFAAVRAALRAAVRGGAVGVKTIAAYRAGLQLRPTEPDRAAVDFVLLRAKAQRGEPVRLTGEPLCHSLLFEAAEECRELEVPLQVHCGWGDPDEDLALTSPLGLRLLLRDPRYEGLRIVLLHCYPYHREAAYLCAVYPDVFMDLSLTIPLAGLDGGRALQEALGICPWTKLLYATDASRFPEVYFVAAAVHREALAAALGELVSAGVLSGDEAIEAGRQVLAGNARYVYRLTTGSSRRV